MNFPSISNSTSPVLSIIDQDLDPDPLLPVYDGINDVLLLQLIKLYSLTSLYTHVLMQLFKLINVFLPLPLPLLLSQHSPLLLLGPQHVWMPLYKLAKV